MDALLDKIYKAIREERAFLDTFVGQRLVIGYNHSTGWARTIDAETRDRRWPRSFMIVATDIEIE
ncbi:MAG: hypothetical protein ACYSVY_00100 [Planctomycetota bacterium]|jgi:hypothetical protein